MNLSEATAIVESLANGIDPVSGEPLPEPGPYHHPRVILVCRRRPANPGRRCACPGLSSSRRVAAAVQHRRETRCRRDRSDICLDLRGDGMMG